MIGIIGVNFSGKQFPDSGNPENTKENKAPFSCQERCAFQVIMLTVFKMQEGLSYQVKFWPSREKMFGNVPGQNQ
jgi:hypothetical protein